MPCGTYGASVVTWAAPRMILTALAVWYHISKVFRDETLQRNGAKGTAVCLDASGDREHLHGHFVFALSCRATIRTRLYLSILLRPSTHERLTQFIRTY